MLMESLGWFRGRGDQPDRIAIEVLAVSRGLKPSGRLTASRASAPAILEFLEARGLVARTYDPEPEEWGYRLATMYERELASRNDLRIYYARDDRSLDAVYDAQVSRDDPALGRALGYPDCCIAMNDALQPLEMADMVRVARFAGTSPDWRLNIFLTELELPGGSPYYLVSHFPCSLDCEASIAYASRLLQAISALDPRFARDLETALRMPVLLRDERNPPEERRFGNSGAILQGATFDETIVYGAWHSLRRRDDLADANLGKSGWITSGSDAIWVHSDHSRDPVRLDRMAWVTVAFQ